MSDEQDKMMLREIHSAVIGNEALGHEGLVKKVKRHEEWISGAKDRKSTRLNSSHRT